MSQITFTPYDPKHSITTLCECGYEAYRPSAARRHWKERHTPKETK